jgi:hypothetical protein
MLLTDGLRAPTMLLVPLLHWAGGPLALLAAGPAFTALGSRTVLAIAATAQLVAMMMLAASMLTRWDSRAPAYEA